MVNNGSGGASSGDRDVDDDTGLNWPAGDDVLQFANVIGLAAGASGEDFVLSFGAFVPDIANKSRPPAGEGGPSIYTIAHVVLTASRLRDLSEMLAPHVDALEASEDEQANV